MKKWKLYIGLVLVFVLGVVAGSLGDRFLHKQRFERMRKDPANRKAFFLKKLSGKLNLTEEQRQAFEPILDQIEKRHREHRERERSQMKAIMDEGFSQMSRQLTPDQQEQLDKMHQRALRFLNRRHHGPPPQSSPRD